MIDFALAVERLVPGAQYHHSDSYQGLFDTWFDARPIPTEAELDQAWADIESEMADAATARSNLKAIAQGTVGKSYTDLTVDELKALLAILIMESGSLESDLTIRPLGQWVR